MILYQLYQKLLCDLYSSRLYHHPYCNKTDTSLWRVRCNKDLLLLLLTHSLTRLLAHSILINLFIKTGLNLFSYPSPAQYGSCPRHFVLQVQQVLAGYQKGEFFVRQHGVHLSSYIWWLTWHEDGFWFNSWSCKIEICQVKQQQLRQMDMERQEGCAVAQRIAA